MDKEITELAEKLLVARLQAYWGVSRNTFMLSLRNTAQPDGLGTLQEWTEDALRVAKGIKEIEIKNNGKVTFHHAN